MPTSASWAIILNALGVVSAADFDLYRAHYGQAATAPLPSVLPLSVTSSPTLSGNVEWQFTFSNVSGALGGHLNIDTHGASVVSEVSGPAFMDVPGLDWMNAIHEGIIIDGTHTFAGLGTTLGSHPSDATLAFMTLVTAGLQPTSLSITGQYGYQGQDYAVDQSAAFVPEPASAVLIILGCFGVLSTSRRNRQRENVCHFG